MSEYRCLLLGETGSGKSTLINYIANFAYGCRIFNQIINDSRKLKLAIQIKNWDKNIIPNFEKISRENDINDSTKSQTLSCNEYLFEINATRYYFIDTPGLNDTIGISNDNQNFESVFNACKKSQFINGVLLILNGTDQRLTVDIKNLFENFIKFFPAKLSENVIIVLTNCNESSCNFDLNYLNGIVRYKSCYFMQNSLLNWDKKNLNSESKKFKRLELDWNESKETINDILNDILSFRKISTNAFQKIEIMTENIHANMNEQLQMILYYLNNCLNLKLQHQSIIESIENMTKNCQHETNHEIEAISFNNNKKIILNIKLKNNEAITQYNHSKHELELARKNSKCLENEIEKSENMLTERICNLAEVTQKLRKECNGFNFINQFQDVLSRLNEVSDIMPYFKIHTDKIFDTFEEVEPKIYKTNSNRSELSRQKRYKCCDCSIV